MYEYKHKVQYYETDKMGIVHHSNHIKWFEEARVEYMEKIGLPYEEVEKEGYGCPVLEARCTYKESFTFADIAKIVVEGEPVEKVRYNMYYTIYKGDSDKVAAKGYTTHCFLNDKGKACNLKKEKPEWYKLFKEHGIKDIEQYRKENV